MCAKIIKYSGTFQPMVLRKGVRCREAKDNGNWSELELIDEKVSAIERSPLWSMFTMMKFHCNHDFQHFEILCHVHFGTIGSLD